MVIGIFAMIFFSAVDVFFVSLLGSTELAAISFTLPVTMLLFHFILGLSIGAAVLVSRAIGESGLASAARITTDSLLFCLILVAGLSALGYASIEPLFRALGATELTLPYIHQYMGIYFPFLVLLAVPVVGNAAIRATGDTKWPSLIMVAGGLLNVVLDPLLIFGFGPIPAMGVAGAAWATVIAWGAGAMGGFYLLYFRRRLLRFAAHPARQMLAAWHRLLKIGVPISLANMTVGLAAAALTRLVSAEGEIAVAGLGAGSRLESFFMVIPFALTSALSPFMAQNMGARQFERAHQALVLCVRFMVKFHLAVLLACSGGAWWLAQIFSADPQVVQITRLYLWIVPLGMGAYGVLILLNTAFNAAQRSDRTLWVALLRVLGLYIPLTWLGGVLGGVAGIFCGATVANILAAFIAWKIYLRTRYRAPLPAVEGLAASPADLVCDDLNPRIS